ncbi:hypothetical protein JX265_003667 [Neoarthrinium moseri]|uniref:Uncharacterized protein n=1 Tax=Neoarthrinium moseri TaxID=1658444 RepID=A0A9P9WSP2_9PEZI|nr:hypothetical protein JX266_001151 [Neoarthrinium moseri]KAI1877659.1 hypothetical protein JX265_003667 [Neoarthrinium moseri]
MAPSLLGGTAAGLLAEDLLESQERGPFECSEERADAYGDYDNSKEVDEARTPHSPKPCNGLDVQDRGEKKSPRSDSGYHSDGACDAKGEQYDARRCLSPDTLRLADEIWGSENSDENPPPPPVDAVNETGQGPQRFNRKRASALVEDDALAHHGTDKTRQCSPKRKSAVVEDPASEVRLTEVKKKRLEAVL